MKTMISTLCLLLACATVNLSGVHIDELKGMQRLDCTLTPFPTDNLQIPLQEDEVNYTWSGYTAVTNFTDPIPESVTKVSGSWTVPTINTVGAVSIWIKIGGCDESKVRLGTSHYLGSSEQLNYGSLIIGYKGYSLSGFPISPGDLIAADLSYIGEDKFYPVLINYTKNVYYADPELIFGCLQQCKTAEWGVDKSFYGYNFWPLADFDKITFTKCSSTINSFEGPIYHTPYDIITMKKYGSTALPSTLTEDGSSFSVIWGYPENVNP